jgi:hypothetical protein
LHKKILHIKPLPVVRLTENFTISDKRIEIIFKLYLPQRLSPYHQIEHKILQPIPDTWMAYTIHVAVNVLEWK